MPDQDRPEPVPRRPARPPRKRDLAETTGYVAGRTATGLTRLLLRSKTVRQTLRNARDSMREDP